MDSLTTKRITSNEEFQSLEPYWNLLLEKSSTRNCFLTWEWLHTWWDVYRRDGWSLHIITVRRKGQLIGIAPFYIQAGTVAGLPTRLLAFLGTQEDEADEVCSMYLDIIAADRDRRDVARQVVRALDEARGDWDVAVFSNLLSQSNIAKEFLAALRKRSFTTNLVEDGVRFVITLPDSWDDYLSSISKKKRKAIRQNARRFDDEGEVREVIVKDKKELDHAYDEMVRLHVNRWRKQGLPGAFGSKLFDRFHRKLVPMLLERGWLDLRFVTLNGNNISVLYNITWGDTVYSYQSGFEYDKHSPGQLSDTLGVQYFINSDYHYYDFLKGDAGSYKGSLGSEVIPMYELVVHPNTARGMLQRLLAATRQSIQKAKGLLVPSTSQ